MEIVSFCLHALLATLMASATLTVVIVVACELYLYLVRVRLVVTVLRATKPAKLKLADVRHEDSRAFLMRFVTTLVPRIKAEPGTATPG